MTLPKKIYLNYVDENDEDTTWSEEPVSVYDCTMQNREYTDLSQVWHLPSEEPEGANWKILCQDKDDCCWVESRVNAQVLHKKWNVYTKIEMIVRWAYVSDILPKGGGEDGN